MCPATYLLKAPEDDMTRWKADATQGGLKFAEHVRRALDAAGGRAPRAAADSARPPARRASTRAETKRTTMCPHRLAPEVFCSQGCDAA